MEQTKKTETIVFGAGCFWCTEAVFSRIRGVIDVQPGYAGGTTKKPTFYEVASKKTGHAEVVKVDFNPNEISLERLLDVFFHTHNPTTLNQQGYDRGPEYRSIILYTNDAQKQIIEEYMRGLTNSGEFLDSIVTEVKKLDNFYDAEPEHIAYYKNNPQAQYCQVVITPKIKKFRERYKQLLK